MFRLGGVGVIFPQGASPTIPPLARVWSCSSGRADGSMNFGAVFLELKEEFWRVFESFADTFEEANALLDKVHT